MSLAIATASREAMPNSISGADSLTESGDVFVALADPVAHPLTQFRHRDVGTRSRPGGDIQLRLRPIFGGRLRIVFCVSHLHVFTFAA